MEDRTEETKEGRLARVKSHLKDNKKVYLVGAGCLAGGYFLRKPQIITMINEATVPVVPTVINTIHNDPVFNNDNSSMVNFGGHVTKMVERVEDGKIWKKVKLTAEEIAEERGVPFERAQWLLSRHLNGHLPDVYGVEYRPIGLGTTN